MQTLFQDILNLLIEPPGNLIYHLVLAFSIVSTLQAALIARRGATYHHTNRLIFGLLMLLLGQVILYAGSGLAWQGVLDEHLFLPPLDRAVVVFSLVWIVWLWIFPSPARLGDLVTGFLNLGVVVLFLFTYTSWTALGSSLPFNNSLMDMVWELAGLFIVLTGMAILLFSRPAGWGFGLSMLGLSLVGLVAHLVLPTGQRDLSGYIRLGQLAAFPLLPALLNRLTAERTAAADQPSDDRNVPFPRAKERRRYSSDPRTVHAWLALQEAASGEQLLSGMTRALAHTMLADMCFIVPNPAYGHVTLQSGYDLLREEEINGIMLEQTDLPMLSNALQRGKPWRVNASDPQPQDLQTLAIELGIKETGSALFIPLVVDDKPQGGLLFLSPYSNRQWNTDDQNYLSSETGQIARILNRGWQQQGTLETVEQAAGDLQIELENLRRENHALLEEISELRRQPAQATANGDLNALIALQEEAQEQIAQLQAENERLQAALKGQGINVLSQDELTRLETDLRATLEEVALLQNQLADANAQNLLLERNLRQSPRSNNEGHEVIVSVAQEIRQPMASIMGYTDLLLAESVGILGVLQRKFLERIKASTERMRLMLEDLVRVSSMGADPVELLPQPVKLDTIIDTAVADTSAHLREKNIALLVDLPQQVPEIHADRDAIQQIVLQLLENAGAATPPEGTITLRARIEQDNADEYLLLQVTDSGGGIHQDELPRVFARRHRADMPLIQGLGDTGVGLSIAKTLAEAHGGRIWVDSIQGQGTTFSVLLPVSSPGRNVGG